MTMSFKIRLYAAVCVLCLAWIIKCLEMPMEDTKNNNPTCKDEVKDCDKYDRLNKKNSCDVENRNFAKVYCRRTCGLCNECIIPSEDIHNGKLTLLKKKHEDDFTLSYTCDEGYYLSSGNLTRTCVKKDDKGNWSGSMPVCSPVLGKYCDANETCGNLLTGSKCIKKICTCSLHYSQFQLKCFKDCGAISLPIVRNSGSDTKYKSVMKVQCTEGYYNANQTDTTSVVNITCSATGDWTNKPNCLRKDCGDISSPNLANIDTPARLHNDTKYNSTAEVDCNEGYYNTKQGQNTGISTTTMTCSSNGSWTNKPTCIIKDCGPLENLTVPNHDLLLVFGETTFNAKATITCKDGYYDNMKHKQPEHTSSTLISCSVNGTWANLPNCTRKDCGNVSTIPIEHAVHRNVHNDSKFESTADIDCDEGFYIDGQDQPPGISTKTIKCLQTGKWNDTPSCIRKKCGTLNNITMTNADNRTEINDTSYNSFANVSCNIGYTDDNGGKIEGIFSKLIRCNENGSWADLPKCVRKDCGSVQDFHLNNTSNVSLHNDTKYGSTADVNCTAGYYNNNNKKQQTNTTSTTTIRCSHEGHWVDLPSCVRKDCGQLDILTILNANNRTLIQTKETKFGSTASIQCDIGYMKKGEKQKEGVSTTIITCDETGTWSVLPQCIKKECGNLTSLDISHAHRRHQSNGTKYESTAQIDCDEGYYNQNDSQTNTTSTTIVTCSDNGKWKNSPTCVPKECGDLDKPSHGSVNLTGKTYVSNATYSCDAGYEIKGNKTVICQATGHWSSNTTTCQIKECERLNATTNGNISQNSTVYGSNATFSCNAGYKMIGPTTIHCNASGLWSNKTTHCEIKDCNSPTKPGNGSSSTPNGTKFEASAFYRCNPGYTLHGSNSTICLDNGTWETVYVNCTLNTCSETSNITNITNGDANVTSSHASYTCKTGYTLHGNATLFCTLNGTWNTQPPKCDVTDCGPLNNPENGNVTNGSTKYNSTANFTCIDGYYLTNNKTSVCEASGNWSIIPKCKIKDCHNLTDPINGYVDQSNGTTYLSVSTYRCDIGYTLKVNNTSKCTKDGIWDNPNVTCEIKDCGNLTKPSNGNITFSHGTVYQSEARYSCDTGYTLHGDDITNCTSSGKWAPHSMNCTINDCGDPGNISNGNVTISNGTKYKSVVTYKCNEGYYTNDSTTINCQADSAWNGSAPNCSINDCGDLTKPSNGNITFSKGTVYQSVARYSCDTGYTLYGDNITNCTSSGKWAPLSMNCTINDCSQPQKPDNGCVKPINGTTYQSQSEYSCKEGYDLIGTNVTVCQANESWSLPIPTCDIRECDMLKNPSNGSVLHNQAKFHYGANATFSCNSGYRLQGHKVVTCTSHGNWSSPEPNCTDIDECKQYTADCHLYADCTNTPGGFECKCRAGFTDISGKNGRKPGRDCEDINECFVKNLNFCNKNGSQCVNYNGGFQCLCYRGWTGKNCTEDIDECYSTTAACGPHATCNNSMGSYECTCDDNYPQGDAKVHCYEKVIIDLSSQVPIHRGDNQLIDAKPIQYRFPYFGNTFNSFRASMNGFLTLGYQPLYENYGAETSTEWQKFSDGHTVIAPFWTDIDSTNLTGGVKVHMFEKYTSSGKDDDVNNDLYMLGNIFSNFSNITNFEPHVALVVTWCNVTQASYIEPTRLIEKQNGTMQAILISDGVYSYLMFNYDHEQWSFKMENNIPSSAGYSFADNTGFILATSDNFTVLNNESNVNPSMAGRWIFNVSSSDETTNAQLRNDTECIKFSYNDTIRNWIKEQRKLAYACPCSIQQMQLDYSYHTVEPMYQYSHPKPTCYEAWFFNNDHVKQTCCYSFGALKKDNVGGGFATFENRPDITEYFYKCCGGDRHLCHLYYEMNPSDDCSRFDPADEPIERKRRSALAYFSGGNDKRRAINYYWPFLVISSLWRLDLI